MSQWDVFVSPAPGSASLLITNLTGHPAVVLPCGFVNDLPVAIMFTGGVYDEVSPLRVALAFERATKWHDMHPQMERISGLMTRISAIRILKEEPWPGFAVTVMVPPSVFDRGFDDVEADATTGDVGDFGGGRKAGLKDLFDH